MICVLRSRSRPGSLTHFRMYFSDRKRSCVLHRKYVDTEMGRAPCPKRDLETQTTHGLQTWQRGLCVHTSSTLCHNPCPVKRGTVVAVKCCVRKARFFRFPNGLWNRTREALALCGIPNHKGETLLVFCFLIPQLSAERQQSTFLKT